MSAKSKESNFNKDSAMGQAMFMACCREHAINGGSCLDDDDQFQQWVDGVDYWQDERVFMGMGG